MEKLMLSIMAFNLFDVTGYFLNFQWHYNINRFLCRYSKDSLAYTAIPAIVHLYVIEIENVSLKML